MPCLRNHIPLAGPATREPCDGTESPLRVSLGFTPRWYHQRLGIDFGQVWHTNPLYRYETLTRMKGELHARFPQVPWCTPAATISGVFGILLIPMLYGAAPVYSPDGWPDAPPIFDREDLRNLPETDLENNPAFLQLSDQMEEIASRWGAIHGYLNYQGIMNIAAKLRGSEIFLDMIDEPELVKSFFSHIAGTILAVSRRVQQRQRESGFDIDLLSLSNCTVSMISPGQYEAFILPLDKELSRHYSRFGIHTCNWVADPYLEAMRKIETMGYLDTGINSDLPRIKQMFPHTRRALLLTPGEVESASASALEEMIQRIHREYAPCDIVLADVESTTPDSRVVEFLELVKEEEARSL